LKMQVSQTIARGTQCTRPQCSSSRAAVYHKGFVPFVTPKQSRTSFVTVQSGNLDSVPLFGASPTFSLSGAPPPVEEAPKPNLDEIPLESEAGMDYAPLRTCLSEADFRGADDETRALLIKLAGEGAVKRGWVYFTEVRTISVKDFKTMDALWKTASNGKFGFSVQKELWVQNSKRWDKFFKQIDWTRGPNANYVKWPMEFIYSMEAVKGHMPLTNALRGTQLFEEIMKHPAFEGMVTKKTLDASAAEASKSTMKFL
jgi:hypothetical protein